ncbi:DUF1345 domain-containing protein [uncultured Mucilaginibacter sp.]|uniref:DUF1345 domain-containing protein n=1 Tax=uncultured Mucilaginibacter sp. TaxID=797541 RepID=UPI0025F61CCF|nr:DUF1345 domain-containing protein [uncultured Mucilaginibacter sp.]
MAKKLTADKRLFFRLDAHYRLLIALFVAAIVFVYNFNRTSPPALALVTWIGCAITIIVLDWIIIMSSHPLEVRKIAKLQDSSRTLLFVFISAASIASLVAIIFLLKSTKGLPEAVKTKHILLAIGAVLISWWLLHTIFTLRYAHLYYDENTDVDGEFKGIGGLHFPGKDQPDYLEFVYFSFIVGMTFQVSDVEISSRRIRRVCLMHSLMSFAFNTAILALSINVISGMVS